MKKQNNNFKTWFEDHKENIKTGAIKIGCCTGCIGLGYLVGTRYMKTMMGAAMLILEGQGYLKGFDPSTGLEVKLVDLNKVF